MARSAVTTTLRKRTRSRNWWPTRPIFCGSSRAKGRFVSQATSSRSAVVLKPADNLVIVDHAGRTQSLIVMEVGDAGHGDGLAHDRSIDMPVCSAPIHRHVVSRGIDRGSNLTITADADMLRRIRWRLNAVQQEIAGLVVTVQDAIPTDVDAAGEINRSGNSGLNHNLSGASDGHITNHV